MPLCNQCLSSAESPGHVYNRVTPPNKWEKFWSNLWGYRWVYRRTKCDHCEAKIGFWIERSKKRYTYTVPDDRRVQH